MDDQMNAGREKECMRNPASKQGKHTHPHKTPASLLYHTEKSNRISLQVGQCGIHFQSLADAGTSRSLANVVVAKTRGKKKERRKKEISDGHNNQGQSPHTNITNKLKTKLHKYAVPNLHPSQTIHPHPNTFPASIISLSFLLPGLPTIFNK